MKKKITSLILMLIFSLSAAFAQEASNAKELCAAIFEMTNDGASMRKVDAIASKLLTDGYKKSVPTASKMDYIIDNDSHFKVKSALTKYTKGGTTVSINIPNAAKYKDQHEVKLIFSNKASRDAFFKATEAYGFERNEAVGDIEYWDPFMIISTGSNPLSVSFEYY